MSETTPLCGVSSSCKNDFEEIRSTVCDYKKTNCRIGWLVYIFCICVFFTTLGICVDGANHEGDPMVESTVLCSDFPRNVSYIELNKKITLWHWIYTITIGGATGEVKMRCPSVMHDMDISFGNLPIGRTNGKIASLISNINLTDCHNNVLYIVRTGDAFETLINMNKIYVTFEVRTPYDNQVVFYVKKFTFITSDFDIFDANGTAVATIKQNKIDDLLNFNTWTWRINVTKQTIDPFIVSFIASHHAFSETNKNGNYTYDGCNQFYYAMFIMLILFAIFVSSPLLLLIGYGCVKAYKCCKIRC